MELFLQNKLLDRPMEVIYNKLNNYSLNVYLGNSIEKKFFRAIDVDYFIMLSPLLYLHYILSILYTFNLYTRS